MHRGLVIISFLGLIVSGYLFIHYVSPEPIACISGEGCKAAQLSDYASFYGIPTPAYGVVFYLALGLLGAVWSESTRKKVLPLLITLTTTGFIVSLFLSGIEAFVLKAWCSWCVASALLSVAAFIITIQLVLTRKKDSYGINI